MTRFRFAALAAVVAPFAPRQRHGADQPQSGREVIEVNGGTALY
jgi:hypothetical protein